MLYVSRRVCADLSAVGGTHNDMGYGIVDTDDGSETIETFENIASACINLGIDIKGAVYFEKPDGTRSVSSLVPFMPYDRRRPVNAKAQMLRWVDVKVYKNTIVDLDFNRSTFRSDSTIRLSDFAEKIGDFILYDSVNYGKLSFTMVFDDRLTHISHSAFALLPGSTDVLASGYEKEGGWPVIGVRFDLRQLKKRDLVMEMYRQLFSCNNAMSMVIDDEKRKMKMATSFGYL